MANLMAMSKAFDLYPKSHEPELSPDLFRNPTSEYRGAPFWAWNNKLDIPQLCRQIEVFKKMGIGGFHMHPRTGLATEYMGKEYMDCVRACVEKARSLNMLAWLYDEDRWPSGAAGGLVTKDPKFAAKHLRWTREPCDGKLVAAYEVVLTDGFLASFRRVGPGEKATWYAYVENTEKSSWFNGETYVDTLSRPAIERFIAETHQKYADAIGDSFGSIVPAIFTDEPNFERIRYFKKSDDNDDVTIAWTTDLPETYRTAYGQDLLDFLPELFWELSQGKPPSIARYRYHDHTAERFASAFADTIGGWCGEHGIALTGHVLEEPELLSQSAHVGDAMRSYRSFQLPGIDMLCDLHEYTTAKQAQSAAHQYGRPGVLSELYGVTNWDFDFLGHKGHGDWQAALGITARVHHLTWVSMFGEAKRDYPASIGYQSPWWQEYPLVEDHFARVDTAMTRGKPRVPVAVIHPIESFWLCYGPLDKTATERAEREEAFKNITDWLLFGLVDFDYVCESLLPSQTPKQDGKTFKVGQMEYQAAIVPAMRTIRATTLDRLEAFADAGGTVIFAGEVPSLVDIQPSDRAFKLADRCKDIPLSRSGVLDAVLPFREVEVQLADGSPAQTILHQMRQDGDKRRLFVCNTDRVTPLDGSRVRLKGEWKLERMDTFTGAIEPLAASQEGGWTAFDWDFEACGHLLLTLSPGAAQGSTNKPAAKWTEIGRLESPVPVTLSEPNVLLLDQAEFRIGDGKWEGPEEVLRIGNEVRERLGVPPVGGDMVQPWANSSPAPVLASVQLKYHIRSGVSLAAPELAVEAPDVMTISLDGKPVEVKDAGYFVDEAIRRVPLPSLPAGDHELILTVPYSRRTEIEWCYLLGDFGVAVEGRTAKLIAPVRELSFGDWTHQGLPFYAGNITYHCRLKTEATQTAIRVPKFRNPLLSVAVDGAVEGKIAFPPYRVVLEDLKAGEHRVDITAFGNRVNAFGAVHNCNARWTWHGPSAWRTKGEDWSYEYQLKPMGIQVAPLVESQ